MDLPTPLFVASRHGHTEIVKMLLDKGADVNVKVKEIDKYYTPLSIAKMQGHTKIVQLLKAAGAKEE